MSDAHESIGSGPREISSRKETTREEVLLEAKGASGMPAAARYMETGNTEDFDMAAKHLEELQKAASTPRSTADVIGIIQNVLPPEQINTLPTLPENLDMEGEQERLKTIRDRLSGVARLTKKSAYMPLFRDGMLDESQMGWRFAIEQDLSWLSDDVRTGDNVPSERKDIFEAYKRALAPLTTLHRTESEQRFNARYNTKIGTQSCVEAHCRNPYAVRGSTRFAVTLALGGLALFGLVSSAFKKQMPSFLTLALAGATILLLRNGSKYAFLSSKQFSELSRAGIDGDAMKQLQNLAKNKSATFNHLVRVLDSEGFHGKTVTEQTIAELTHPSKNKENAVPEHIARLFLGQNAANAAYVLKGIQSTSRHQDKGIVPIFAQANHDHEDIQKDFTASSSAP